MTVEPALSYSTRQPYANYRPQIKANASIFKPHFAALLIFLGAIRFLRAQRLPNKLIQFYLPLLKLCKIQPETRAPLLRGRPTTPEATTCENAVAWIVDKNWNTIQLGFQTLQTQGAQQSISISRGYFDLSHLISLREQGGIPLLRWWRYQLAQPNGKADIDVDLLANMLLNPSLISWEHHLLNMAWSDSITSVRLYSLSELQRITQMLVDSTCKSPLAKIILAESGTIRFANTLKSIGELAPTDINDLRRELQSVKNLDHLLEVIAQIAQTAIIYKSRSEFVVVPNSNDLVELLEDVEVHGVERIARLIIVLSAVYFPPRDKKVTELIAKAEEETHDKFEERNFK